MLMKHMEGTQLYVLFWDSLHSGNLVVQCLYNTYNVAIHINMYKCALIVRKIKIFESIQCISIYE